MFFPEVTSIYRNKAILIHFNPRDITMKVAVLFSGGKDSTYALWVALHQYRVETLLSFLPESDESWLFHHPNIHITEKLARCIDLPLLQIKTKIGAKEELKSLIKTLKELHDIEALVTGGLLSEFQRFHFNRACRELNIPCFSPLWRKNQYLLLKELIDNNFHIIFSSVSSMGLKREHLGKRITAKVLSYLQHLNRKFGFSIGGEGGEYETLVIDAPFFKKRLEILDYDINWDPHREVGTFIIKSSVIVTKPIQIDNEVKLDADHNKRS